MKKISLKNLNLNEVESLSREQLKNVLGGFAGGTTSAVDDCKDVCGGALGSCTGQNQGCLTYTCDTNALKTYKACGYNGNGTIS